METSVSKIKFRIDIDFDGCEVDMVLKEMSARRVQTPVPSILCVSAKIPIDKSKLKKTPTEASVEFSLSWLAGFVDRNKMQITDSKWDKDYTKNPIIGITESGMEYTTWNKELTELELIGIDVTDWYGLMQGTCHLNCECFIDVFSKSLIKKAERIVNDIFKKYVIYYK